MAQEATRLDPDYSYAWITLGWTYWQEAYSGCSDSIERLIDGAVEANQNAQSLDYFQQGLEIQPDSPLCRFYLIDAWMEKDDAARARRLADEIRALDSSVTGKGIVHANSSDPAERQRFRENLSKFHLV